MNAQHHNRNFQKIALNNSSTTSSSDIFVVDSQKNYFPLEESLEDALNNDTGHNSSMSNSEIISFFRISSRSDDDNSNVSGRDGDTKVHVLPLDNNLIAPLSAAIIRSNAHKIFIEHAEESKNKKKLKQQKGLLGIIVFSKCASTRSSQGRRIDGIF